MEKKTAEEVLRQDKYKALSNLVLVCEAMEEYSTQQNSELVKENEELREAGMNALSYLRTLLSHAPEETWMILRRDNAIEYYKALDQALNIKD